MFQSYLTGIEIAYFRVESVEFIMFQSYLTGIEINDESSVIGQKTGSNRT